MLLEQAQVPLRPRENWQAVDVGFDLARRHFSILFWLSAIPHAVLALLLYALLFAGLDPDKRLGWWLFLMWWFKPVFEQAMFAWLGRAMFGELLTWRVILRQWMGWSLTGIVGNLTWRRLSGSRGMSQIVQMLEGLHGSARSQRLGVLARANHNSWVLTISMWLLQLAWLWAVFALIRLLLPEMPDYGAWTWGQKFEQAFQFVKQPWALILAYVLVVSVVTPFYVGATFMLYINARTQLEAWDLTIAARRMRARWSAIHVEQNRKARVKEAMGQAMRSVGLSLLGVFVAVVLQSIQPTWAQTPVITDANVTHPSVDEMKQQAQEIVADEATFGGVHLVKKRVWDFGTPKPPTITKPKVASTWFNSMADILRWLAYVVIAAVVLWIVSHLVRQRWVKRASSDEQASIVPTEYTPPDEQLPSTIAQSAEQKLAAGDTRAALAALYQSTLAYYADKRAIDVGRSATEGEAWYLLLPEISEHDQTLLKPLWQMWQRVAYQHAPVNADEVGAMIQTWRVHYGHA